MDEDQDKDFNYFFRQDILKLFSTFNQLNSFRFTDFVEVWNEMKFFQIFSIPRFYPFDYRYLFKDIFKITVEYLYDGDLDLEVRTAALYTLYSLYYHQMSRPRMKIPVTPNRWIQILQFIDLINQAEHVDVEFTFRYLLHSDAFEFCSFHEIQGHIPSLRGYPGLKPCKLLKNESKDDEVVNMNKFVDSILNDKLTEEMGTIHEAYLQIKELANENIINSKLNYINPNFRELIGADGLNVELEDNTNEED